MISGLARCRRTPPTGLGRRLLLRRQSEGLVGGLTISNSKFENNHAAYDGGGFYAGEIRARSRSGTRRSRGTRRFRIDGSANPSEDGSLGGAMGFDDLYGVTTITNTTISGNRALDYGGGITTVDANGAFTMDGSPVTGNSARVGGGLDFYEGEGAVSIVNSTISGNHSTVSGPEASTSARSTVPCRSRTPRSRTTPRGTVAVVSGSTNGWPGARPRSRPTAAARAW